MISILFRLFKFLLNLFVYSQNKLFKEHFFDENKKFFRFENLFGILSKNHNELKVLSLLMLSLLMTFKINEIFKDC